MNSDLYFHFKAGYSFIEDNLKFDFIIAGMPCFNLIPIYTGIRVLCASLIAIHILLRARSVLTKFFHFITKTPLLATLFLIYGIHLFV
jgi:hypothetical protein